ncbi:hypothetical protein ACFWUP_24295 [Nocardia sp. NPDC058658]|uniref:hypothetical protein n=1 Tax=Nocardia sp. NPDC058658 TaxID=3346580 RepID=UPI00366175EA
MIKDYFTVDAETWNYNDAKLYIEFTDSIPTRQVTQVGERWATSRHDNDPDIGPLLTDQPLQPGEFDESDRISADSFEQLWTRAVAFEDRT